MTGATYKTGVPTSVFSPLHAATLTAVANVYTPTIQAVRNVAYITTPAANFAIAIPIGSVPDGATLTLNIHCAATAARTFTWSGPAGIIATQMTLPSSGVAGKTISVEFVWNAKRSLWVFLGGNTAGF